jgi:SAM-dependent methyltransferase
MRLCYWALILWLAAAVHAQNPPETPSGVEIPATVTGQADRETYNRFMSEVRTALALKPGGIAADLGTGAEVEHPLNMSRMVGESGRILCVDISREALDLLERRIKDSGAGNIRTQLGGVADPKLAPASLDAVLIANAYHEFTERAAMLERIRIALKPGGRLVVIEAISTAKRNAAREEQVKTHELAPELLLEELKAAGFDCPGGFRPLLDHSGVLRYLVAATRK